MIDTQLCQRCALHVDEPEALLCESCQRATLGEHTLWAALRRLNEDRHAEAVRLIEDALETLRP